ncbi:MAG TPA: hypothetical protein VE152_08115, partial [Acidimicrobiales bacterium]|nr:hypothetical protein [Acidimicrobiales bacterium]
TVSWARSPPASAAGARGRRRGGGAPATSRSPGTTGSGQLVALEDGIGPGRPRGAQGACRLATNR